MWYYISILLFFFFFFNDTATTEIYTLSLHDALPILGAGQPVHRSGPAVVSQIQEQEVIQQESRLRVADNTGAKEILCIRDRKSTRLNSSHANISYAVFCLKKKKTIQQSTIST